MRAGLLLSLAWADYRGEARLSLCAIFALAAVITPLLVLFGLKYGLVSTLTERLERAPSVREIIPVGGARYRAEDIAALAARADVAFAVPRTRQIAATADLSGGGETALSVEMIPSAAGDPLLAGLPQPD
ncbi:TPA: type IV secretion associated ABC transporter permease TagS, partial [Pseudomonas aeruginosa]|nr:ABC transporter permease [Pseudomonas aeruginosa]